VVGCSEVDRDGLAARAAARIGTHDTRTAIGYWVGAIRETFEEVGILLAYDAAGHHPRVDAPRFAEYRKACETDNLSLIHI